MPGTRLGYLTRVIRHGKPKNRPNTARPIVHGTENAYGRRGCRCCECKAAHCARARERRSRPKTWPTWAHGRNATYIDGCRCQKCKTAHAAYRARWYARCRKRRRAPAEERRAARLAYMRDRYQQIKAGTWRARG